MRIFLRPIRRFVLKHRAAVVGFLAFQFILFFPTLFMGRILNPDDVYYHYPPWSSVRSVEAQNPLIHDGPMSYISLVALLQKDRGAFHWIRHVASGIPGFGSAAAAVLSPFVVIPGLLLPLPLVYSGIVILKFSLGFVFAYLWLREERVGKSPAALGAIFFSGAGVYAVWWLWQGTNATTLYPAILFVLLRAVRGKRVSTVAVAVLFLAYLLSGFPAAIAYGFYLASAYGIRLLLRQWKTTSISAVARIVVAGLLALLISAPLLMPYVRFLQNTGYLEKRAAASRELFFPIDHLAGFWQPDRLGSSSSHLWRGDPRLGSSNNFVESTIYLGVLGLPLAFVGLARSRSRARWFWLIAILIIGLSMFFDTPIARAIGYLPGMAYTPLTRLRLLLPVPLAYLAASGLALILELMRRRFSRRGRTLAWVTSLTLIAMATIDLGTFAARFHPYLPRGIAEIPSTPTLDMLRAERAPHRIAPFFGFLMPNTAQRFGLEDIRSHWGAERTYRRLLERIDPSSSSFSTVILLHSLRANPADPLLSMLNVRYLLEGKSDILHWGIYDKTVSETVGEGDVVLRSGESIERLLRVDREPYFAVELNVRVRGARSPESYLQTEVLRPETGEVLFDRAFTAADIAARPKPKLYLPLFPQTQLGNAVVVRITAHELTVVMPKSDDTFTIGKVGSSLILSHGMPEGPVYENLAVQPRYFAIWDLRELSFDEMLAQREIDFTRQAIVHSPAPPILQASLAGVPREKRSTRFQVLQYDGHRQVIRTRSNVPFLFASSEKLTSELRVTVDGAAVDPLKINGMFTAVPLQSGEHEVVLSRRIGRGLWLPSFGGMLILGAIALSERRGRRSDWMARVRTVPSPAMARERIVALRNAVTGAGSRIAFLAGIGFALGSGAYLRFVDLGGPSLWLDELLNYDIVTAAKEQPWYAWLTGFEVENGPLYYALQLAARPWGDLELGFRLAPALVGTVTILLLALSARALGRATAAVAAILMAASPFHVYYSREGRGYALLVCAMVLILLALLRPRSSGTREYGILGCLVAAFTAASAAPLLAAALVSAALAALREFIRERDIRKIAPGYRFVSLGAVAGLAVIAVHYLRFERSGAVLSFPPLTARLTLNIVNALSSTALDGAPLQGLTALCMALAIAGAVALSRRDRAGLIVLLSMTVFPVVATILSLRLMNHWFSLRYVIAALPAFVILMALGICETAFFVARLVNRPRVESTRPARVSAIVSAVAIAFLTTAVVWGNLPRARSEARQKPDWREAAATLASRARSGDRVVASNAWSAVCLMFYLREFPIELQVLNAEESITKAKEWLAQRPVAWMATGGYHSDPAISEWMKRGCRVWTSPFESAALYFYPDCTKFYATRSTEEGETFLVRSFIEKRGSKIEFSDEDADLVQEGWWATEQDLEGGTFRWAGKRAVVLLPISDPLSAVIEIRAGALAIPGDESQKVRIVINGRPGGELELAPGFASYELKLAEGLLEAGVNQLVFEFEKATRPSDIDSRSTDTRELSAAFDSLKVRYPRQ